MFDDIIVCVETLLKDPFNVVCLKFLISKGLSFGIILGSVVVKVPQILKIIQKKSVVGISLMMFVLEVIGFSLVTAYSYLNGYAFSTYGEAIFLLIQSLVLVYLHALYSTGITTNHFLAAIGYIGTMIPMLLGHIPMSVVTFLFTFNIVVFSASKIPQIITSFRTKVVGQLSLISFALIFLGNLARVFTTLQEVPDTIVLVMNLVSLALNGTIVGQIVFYGYMKNKIGKEE